MWVELTWSRAKRRVLPTMVHLSDVWYIVHTTVSFDLPFLPTFEDGADKNISPLFFPSSFSQPSLSLHLGTSRSRFITHETHRHRILPYLFQENPMPSRLAPPNSSSPWPHVSCIYLTWLPFRPYSALRTTPMWSLGSNANRPWSSSPVLSLVCPMMLATQRQA